MGWLFCIIGCEYRLGVEWIVGCEMVEWCEDIVFVVLVDGVKDVV